MLRGLLRDSDAAKELFEKVGLFKDPELLEKYVIASEVTVEVLDMFLSRVFGTERPSSGDLKSLGECFGFFSLGAQKSSSGRAAEPDKATEELAVKVQDLERQLCAVQRQIQMQGEAWQWAASLDRRLDEIGRVCERRVAAVSDAVARLNKEVSDRARTADVRSLCDAVARLKESERILGDRISGVEKKGEDAGRVPKDENRGEIIRLGAAVGMSPRHILYDSKRPLDGIIAHLTRMCGGNVHEKGVVGVTTSSVCQFYECYDDDSGVSFGVETYDPEHTVELGTDSVFRSNYEWNPWICYDFKKQRVVPTSYSIRAGKYDFLRSWVLEVSSDRTKNSWKVVDRREDNEDMKGSNKHVTRNFMVSAPPSEAFRFVRLRQTEESYCEHCLEICALELFGTLFSQ